MTQERETISPECNRYQLSGKSVRQWMKVHCLFLTIHIKSIYNLPSADRVSTGLLMSYAACRCRTHNRIIKRKELNHMEITEFCVRVKEELEKKMGEEATVTVRKIMKNNGIVLNSIIIAERERNISPNIYMEELYEAYLNGESLETVIKEVTELYRESRLKDNIDMGFFLDYAKVKERVVFKVINREKNEELLEQIPFFPFLDLAVVFYCRVMEEELNSATVMVYNEHLKLWGITGEELLADAGKNTRKLLPARILPMEDIMKEIFSSDLEKEFEQAETEAELMPEKEWFDRAADQMLYSITESKESLNMYVAGNRDRLFGAAVILYEGLLKQFAERIGGDFFLLPSSIHEMILIPDDGSREKEKLWEMVCDINRTQVEPEDILADSLYFFSRACGKIEKLY